jgi:hypothetical protein
MVYSVSMHSLCILKICDRTTLPIGTKLVLEQLHDELAIANPSLPPRSIPDAYKTRQDIRHSNAGTDEHRWELLMDARRSLKMKINIILDEVAS